MTTNYEELKKKMKILREEMKESAKTFFQDASKDLFATHPELEQFSWTQYTPYFNDGDECVFGVNSDKPDINRETGWDMSDERALYETQQSVGKLLQTFGNDDMKAMFGDHCRVTVTRTGIDVEQYKHD